MKKKLLTLAMAAVMVVSSTISSFAAAEEIEGNWWTAWTSAYEVKDGETVEFDIDVKGGLAQCNNLNAIFINAPYTGTTQAPKDQIGDTYKEYAVIRADSWGWGGGDLKSVDGKAITFENSMGAEDYEVFSTENVNTAATWCDEKVIDMWDDLTAIFLDAHVDAKISRSGDKISLEYVVTGADGHSFTYNASTEADLSAGLYVMFGCDASTVSVEKVEASAGANGSGDADDSDDSDANANGGTTPDTGDGAMVGILLAVAAVSAVVVLKRRTVAE